MLDINKLITNSSLQTHFPDGHMYDLAPWSHAIAQQQANAEGLGELSEAQWVVIHTLRGFYRQNGRAANSRVLTRELQKIFPAEGGRRYLYELFPNGPVTQGSRLAGVPAPPYSSDPSFGSTS
jgi:TusE/DsrC/DsvC family sulfur relay protein